MIVGLTIPTQEAAGEETDAYERSRARRQFTVMRGWRAQKFIERDAGSQMRQIDGPYVVKLHVGEKVMDPKW